VKNRLAKFVRDKRVLKKLSASDVERNSCGRISDAYVLRIESGNVANVSPEKLDALADGLGIPADEIYRIARGLPQETPKDRLEILAETFGGKDLTEQDWAEIEAVLKTMIDQKKRQKK
jgi:transcriptional regulator with XRE-family HTH domain